MAIQESIIKPKTDALALRIIKLYKHLRKEKKEYVLSTQLLRSGTSVGANVTEAQYAQSKPDFKSKMNIALKEAAESEYWLQLLYKSDYLTKREYDSIMADLTPIIKILIAIVKNTRI